MQEELVRLRSWVSEVYLPKLRSRDYEMVFEGSFPGNSDERFSERFLQIVWNEQVIDRELATTDGRSVRVVHPGTWNVAGGPDFLHASLVIGEEVVRGDVEIHRRTSDWRRHGHSGDCHYDQVVLHVVWQDDETLAEGPSATLELRGHLEASWHVLLQDVEEACYPYARQVGAGQCSVRWALSEDSSLRTVLASAGLACLSAKGDRLRRRCATAGVDQALYEKFFDCLGFRHNRQAFGELCRLVPLSMLSELSGEDELEGILFGVAGLLPDLTRTEVLPVWRDRVKRMWEIWWSSGLGVGGMHWFRGGCRPFNSPERRLAAGVRWLRDIGCRPRAWLDGLGRGCTDGRDLTRAVLRLDFGDSLWNWHRDFATAFRHPAKLLGQQRLRDIMGNLCLPYWVSLEGEGNGLADVARESFVGLSCGQGNRLLTEASHRFLSPPSRSRDLLLGYCHQQGLMDIYRNFCLVFNGDCDSCPFGVGERVRGA